MRDRWDEVRRGAAYLLVCLVTAVATLLALPLLLLSLVTTALGGLGLVLFPRTLLGLRRWAEWHRRRAARLLGVTVAPRRTGLPEGVRAQWRGIREDPGVRRDLRWSALHFASGFAAGAAALLCVGGMVGGAVATGLWWAFPEGNGFTAFGVEVGGWGTALSLGLAQTLVAAGVTWRCVPWLARAHAGLSVRALEPSARERLAERVGELTESRAGVVDAHGAELRRIERDLHDGTQARLVAIAMRLGVAREALRDDPSGTLARLLQEAHEGAEEAMTELRQVIRTMYPPILADRGLDGALAALAAQSAVPVELDTGGLDAGGPGQVPAAVEAAAYFTVAEAVTNAAKHSGASRVVVRLSRSGGGLLVEVTDDGLGGVDESRGSGVVGIRRRAAALDGTVLVSSPPGGPTALTVELPCGS
ncbi:sensor histidine kinase [Streptomyces avicenniae]|uniref:sensor histidine kinase n=1 Tax=Streptomyces avicenniae TaxID=500153 RepID=UPI00069C0864|nr:sensor histidine kinase [Streptomyces avicenniae]